MKNKYSLQQVAEEFIFVGFLLIASGVMGIVFIYVIPAAGVALS